MTLCPADGVQELRDLPQSLEAKGQSGVRALVRRSPATC